MTVAGELMSKQRLAHFERKVEEDIADGAYYGAAVRVARRGEVLLDLAVGSGDRDGDQVIRQDSVFSIFSLTKAFTNVLVLRAAELGRLALTDRVVDILPEFVGSPRDRATVLHLLTHSSGMPGLWEVGHGTTGDRLDDVLAVIYDHVHGVVEPGQRCDYSPMVNHALLGEVLRRTDPDGRGITEILTEDLFAPLGMVDTAFGIKPHMRPRHVVPDMRGTIPVGVPSTTRSGEYGLFEADSNEATWVGTASTTADLHRFAEMLRTGGTLDGTEILSPRTIEIARRNWTGEIENELTRGTALRAGLSPSPAYIGLGFNVRGTAAVRHQFGLLASAETYGNAGAGSSLLWVDPTTDVTFVALTAGVMASTPSLDRFQRLSDVVHAAVR
ncbi:serine hydrolase domain-containing protein [Pseudonocardia pini]|uniref:serine hydrolase domain-containing protein n=1 Tax=Pseudonocardia pini TaxID=2758030 RepID=UPI0015F07295|nr:serine hydrolase domain-containing protein [Pseudonocardia pini]